MSEQLNIYLLRGLTRESGHWGDFLKMLQDSLPEANIHLLDLPGAGKHVHEKASIKVSKMVDFMRNQTLDQIQKSSNNIFCATSLGGMLACDWVIRYKDDFQGLVMINSSFKYICTSQERAGNQVRWDMVKILFSNNIKKREALIIKVNSNKPELYEDLTNEWTAIQRKRKMSRMNILRQSISGFLYGLKDQKPELPLLIIGSKGDRMVCPECIIKTHKAFGGTLAWHPDAGHGLPIDDPLWLSQTISNWSLTTYIEERAAKN